METCLIVLAAVLLVASHCKSATLTIDPHALSISNATGSAVNVTVKCAHPFNLISLTISRNLTSNLNVSIQIAAATTKNVVAHMLQAIPGASASGSLSQKFIMVTMTLVSCNDAGMYSCTAFDTDSSISGLSSVDNKLFTVQALPGQITLTAMPPYIYYESQTTLEMSCNGQVGGTASGMQISWIWEYQEYQGSTWNSYMTDSDIAPPTPSLPDNSCQNNQVSVLTRILRQEDTRRTYRCYVRRNGQSYVQFAGMYKIGIIGESAKITISPPSMSILSNNTGSVNTRVTVKCTPPGYIGPVITLNIFRFLINNPQGTEIASASLILNNGSAQMMTPMAGASVSGSLTERSITVTMTLVSCNDSGIYRCTASYVPIGLDTVVAKNTEDKNFTVHVLPGPITLTASPNYSSYELNATLEMSCSGEVGSTNIETLQLSWVWEYQDPGKSFTPYMPESDIAPPMPPLPNNSCKNNQSSVLKRKLTPEDAGRTYRCYVHRNGQSFAEFAGTYKIGTVASKVTAVPSKVRQPDADAGVAWWIIVVAVVGGFLLCIVVGIAIFKIRRSQIIENKPIPDENKDESKDDDETSSIPPVNVVQALKTYLHLDPWPEKESDRESAVDFSEGAFDTSSRSQIREQEEMLSNKHV